MNSAQRAKFKKGLEAIEAALLGKSKPPIETNRAHPEETVTREDEQPLNEMLQSIASNRNRNSAATLGQVRRALQKIAEEPDTFGECEECGDDIPLGRLKAMPYADLCVACQAKRDGPRAMPTRKKLTDLM